MKRTPKFDIAVQYILNSEGEEFTQDPNDRGGATKWGVTLRTIHQIPEYQFWTADNLRKLTSEQAKDVYYEIFWLFEEVKSQRVATKLLDIFVNLPPKKAILIFQTAANMSGGGGNILPDSQWGPRTIAAINSCDPDTYLTNLVKLIKDYYIKIAAANLSQVRFLKGWLKRATRLPKAD